MKFILAHISRQKGMALFTVLAFIPVLLLLLGAIIQVTVSESYNLLLEKRSEQTMYLAMAGAEFGQYYFSAHIFEKFTHSSPTAVQTGGSRLPVPDSTRYGQGFSYDPDGWIQWQWDQSKPYASFLGTPYNESFKFMVYPVDYTKNSIPMRDYVMKVVATLGYANNSTVRTIIVRGEYVDLFQYAIFDAGTLGEFVRGFDQIIYGKVYADGDIYMNPNPNKLLSFRASNYDTGISPSDETLLNSKTGRIYTDFKVYDKWSGSTAQFDNWQGASINVQKAGTLNQLVDIRNGSDTNYDSMWSDWNSNAIERWNGAVRDVNLTPECHDTPSFESFMPDNYYYNEAVNSGILIDGTGAVKVNGNTAGSQATTVTKAITTNKIFWNPSEWRRETYVEVDMLKLLDPNGVGVTNTSQSVWANNSVIYLNTPALIKNAAVLPGNAVIVSPYNIYVQGDFNMEHPPTLVSNPGYSVSNKWKWNNSGGESTEPTFRKKTAAVITTNKIYHLSGGFAIENYDATDGNQACSNSKWGSNTGNQWQKAPEACGEQKKHKDDETNVVEFNALSVDGSKVDDDRYYVGNYTVKDASTGLLTTKNNPYYKDDSFEGGKCTQFPNGDQFMEKWGSAFTMKKRGAIVHLQNSIVADFDNSNVGAGIVGWTCAERYLPPTRDYGYDPSGGQSYRIDKLPKSIKSKSWQIGGSNLQVN